MQQLAVSPATTGRYDPTAQEVDWLVDRAASHPLGLEFLTTGALDAVAATFGVHAFVVDAARRSLDGRQAPAADRRA